MNPVYLREVEAARAAAAGFEDAYLRRFGWSLTWDNPAALWLWVRDFAAEDAVRNAWCEEHNERTRERQWGIMALPKETALAITVRNLDEQRECSDEDEVEG